MKTENLAKFPAKLAAQPIVPPGWAHRRLEGLLDIWEDGSRPPDERAYVDGALTDAMEETRALLAAAQQPEPLEVLTRVYLVATGAVYEGQETYTRHDVRPQLCDAETLYSRPAPVPAVEPPVVAWRPEVVAFANAMESKLRENDHKGGWDDCGVGYLGGRLEEEVIELKDAVLHNLGKGTAHDSILGEAADVANFAMMIADVSGVLRHSDSQAAIPAAQGAGS